MLYKVDLLCLVKCFSHFSLLGPHPQLALSVGFLFESLFVGAPCLHLSCTPKCLAKIRLIDM
ncbi:hypothetical protein B7469_03335 [Staphylococcus lugdunensis]|nr:hypothetical protein B7469_03335 [Staphylococcus lugdunensis]